MDFPEVGVEIPAKTRHHLFERGSRIDKKNISKNWGEEVLRTFNDNEHLWLFLDVILLQDTEV